MRRFLGRHIPFLHLFLTTDPSPDIDNDTDLDSPTLSTRIAFKKKRNCIAVVLTR